MSELCTHPNENPSRILLVDDDEAIRGVIGHLLVHLGFFCATAVNGLEALAQLQQGKFDLLVTDIQMPGMDGVELIRQVREKFPRLGVIWMTGFIDNVLLEKMFQLGAVEYLLKPFGQKALCSCIRRVWEQQDALMQTVERKSGSLCPPAIIDEPLSVGRVPAGRRSSLPGTRR